MANRGDQECERIERLQECGYGRLRSERVRGSFLGRVRRECSDSDKEVKEGLEDVDDVAEVVVLDKFVVRCATS